MNKAKKEADNYYHCEGKGCNFKCKKVSKLIYFKGKRCCFRCVKKLSKSINHVPKRNPSEKTLNRLVKLRDIENLPKAVKFSPQVNCFDTTIENNQLVNISLSSSERAYLYHHFASQGFIGKEIYQEINKIKEIIRNSHIQFKDYIKNNKTTFKDSFNKLVEVKA